MIVGMVLAGLAFVVAGFVQFKVQAAQDTLNSDESKLVLFNSAPFPIEYHFSFDETEASNQTLDNGEVSFFYFENDLFQSFYSRAVIFLILKVDL